MTAYEASDLLNGVISNLFSGETIFISIISAYLVVAYTVGKKLTEYQVWYINVVYILFLLIVLVESASLVRLIYEYNAIRVELLPAAEPVQRFDNVTIWMSVGVRLALMAGSLVFMWQIRHPKTELPL